MKIKFTGQYSYNPMILMRKCGYGQLRPNRKGEVSYARHFGAGEYPRFHVYVDLHDDGFQVNLHIDQKKPTYGSHTAHSGEYDGELVEREAARIRVMIEGMKIQN